MKRRNFLRDIAAAIAATILPKIIQPITTEITEEELFVDVPVRLKWSDATKTKVDYDIVEKSNIRILHKVIRCGGKPIDIEFMQRMFPEKLNS